jgi:hypothetical protein
MSAIHPVRTFKLRQYLTVARSDRAAGLDRDLGAIDTVLHQDAGVPADAAITRARETFRPGESMRTWWKRAAAG